jgi:cytochrome c-type biogenesis protein CcmE
MRADERPASGRWGLDDVGESGMAGIDAMLGGSSPEAPPRPDGRRAPRKRLRHVVVAVVIVGAIGFIVFKGIASALVYYRTVNQAVADRAELGTRAFRIEGTVVAGTIRRSGDTVDFEIASHGVSLPVVATTIPPQLFRAGRRVVLDGHFESLTGPDTFLSDQILVKHSSNYAPAKSASASTAAGGTKGTAS